MSRTTAALGEIARASDRRRDKRRVAGGYHVRAGQISHVLRERRASEQWVRWMAMPLSARRLGQRDNAQNSQVKETER